MLGGRDTRPKYMWNKCVSSSSNGINGINAGARGFLWHIKKIEWLPIFSKTKPILSHQKLNRCQPQDQPKSRLAESVARAFLANQITYSKQNQSSFGIFSVFSYKRLQSPFARVNCVFFVATRKNVNWKLKEIKGMRLDINRQILLTGLSTHFIP